MMIKVLQFGEGNFLRTFADAYFDTLKLPTRTIEMKDDEKYLEYFANGGCVIKFMQDESVLDEDLTKYEGFATAVKTIVKKLRSGETDIL